MNKIYYDPTGGFLYGIDSNNQPKIVKTDACVMMPENIFVDSNGYIHVKNLDDTETIIQDELGNPASIMGPAGPIGQTGNPGILGPAGNDGKDGVSIKLIDSLLNLELTGQTAYIYMLTLDDYDEAIGKVEAGSLYEHSGNAWAWKGSIRGPKGDNGIDGQDVENPFTDEEVLTLKELPNTLNDLQGLNVSEFQTISKQIKEVSDNLNYANALNAGLFGRVHSRINALEAKLTALELTLQNIDLSGLAVAYPISTEE